MRPLQFPFSLLSLLILLVFATNAQAQDPDAKPPVPCSTPEYRQMDFWIGDWNVTNPKGKIVGTNRIDQILGTCVVMENWEGRGGSVGHSFNIYNSQNKRWEQTWVDNGGNVIYFHGTWDEEKGQMVYFSETVTKKNEPLLYRMIYTPNDDGTVRQFWEASLDAAQTWSTLFDGVYSKKK